MPNSVQNLPNSIQNFQNDVKNLPILKNYQQTFKFGEILPNVVTLIWGIYTNKAFNEFAQDAN